MSAWIGPAIIAALISAMVTAMGWYASHVSHRRIESARRRERVRDVQIAVRAEIRSHRAWLQSFDTEHLSGDTAARIRSMEGYTPFVPREIETFVFNAVVAEIHILPSAVIDEIVRYYRQVYVLGRLADDLRSERFSSLEAGRKAEMYEDYIGIGVYALDLADETIEALNASLIAGGVD
jgi:hypothetical protein